MLTRACLTLAHHEQPGSRRRVHPMGKVMVVDDAAVVLKVMEDILESDWAMAKSQGVADYLPKPFSTEELLTMVRRFVPDEEWAYVGAAPARSVKGAMSEAVPSFFFGFRPFGPR
jgi:hypothetical protein